MVKVVLHQNTRHSVHDFPSVMRSERRSKMTPLLVSYKSEHECALVLRHTFLNYMFCFFIGKKFN